MGAAVSAISDQIGKMDDAKGKEAEIKEALENMRQTTQDLLDGFSERIRNRDHDTHLIPISKILLRVYPVHLGQQGQLRVRQSRMPSRTFLLVLWRMVLQTSPPALLAIFWATQGSQDSGGSWSTVNPCFETSDLGLRKAIYGELRDPSFYSKNPEYIATLKAAREENQEKMRERAIAKPVTHAAA